MTENFKNRVACKKSWFGNTTLVNLSHLHLQPTSVGQASPLQSPELLLRLLRAKCRVGIAARIAGRIENLLENGSWHF